MRLFELFKKQALHPCWMIRSEAYAYEAAHQILQHDNATLPPSSVSLQIEKGSYPYFLVQKTPPLVEDVRALIDALKKKMTQVRVVLIVGIDEINAHAANALLKILEEPPAQTFFFLTYHLKEKVLPTLRSRCLFHAYDKESKKSEFDVSFAFQKQSTALLKQKSIDIEADEALVLEALLKETFIRYKETHEKRFLDLWSELETFFQSAIGKSLGKPRLFLQAFLHVQDALAYETSH